MPSPTHHPQCAGRSTNNSGFLAGNLNHPSLHAKKYNEAKDIWQGRANRNWRFYFVIEDDTVLITDVTPHPK